MEICLTYTVLSTNWQMLTLLAKVVKYIIFYFSLFSSKQCRALVQPLHKRKTTGHEACFSLNVYYVNFYSSN